jgi:hypothetical protein
MAGFDREQVVPGESFEPKLNKEKGDDPSVIALETSA